jgi:predicted  nucleic acid-binding Zn-ribbon protein
MRRRGEDKIKRLNENLERRVAARTAELAVQTAELERINKMFVNRELRMRELKARIAELENRLS